MDYNLEKLIPYITPCEYDKVANDFLESYYPEALYSPVSVPIYQIAKDMGLDIQEVCLSEELSIYGATVFTDGLVDIFVPEKGLYEKRKFKRKTILIDPEAVKRTNIGCMRNTLAHECVHWYKHRLYYKMQELRLPRMAMYCKCKVNQISFSNEDEVTMEYQAVGIAPRILMPKHTFIEAASKYKIIFGQENLDAVCGLSELFQVSKQSVKIRLKECGLV